MNFLELPKNAFRLKLSPTLLSQLAVVNVNANEFVEFVTAQFQTIITCKPNCRRYSSSEKPIWVLRGYYPNTPVFFKLTVVKTGELTDHAGNNYFEDFAYYVRARELQVRSRAIWNQTLLMNKGEIVLFSNDIMKNITTDMENTLLGATNEVKPLIKGGPVKPKCMSPKGMKLLKYKKPRKKREI